MKRLALVLAILAPQAVLAQEQPPTDTERARQQASGHFRRGVALFEEGDREAALVEFERAYEAYPSYAVLYNVGQTALALRRYVRALRALEQYVAEGGGSIPVERMAEVQSMIETLRSRTAHLRVSVDIEGAAIAIDDAPFGTSPLADPVVVDVGRHSLVVRADGYESFTREIVVAGGDETDVDVVMVRRAEQSIVTLPTALPGRDNTVQALGIAGFVATGLCAAAAVVTGVLALGQRDQLQALLQDIPADVAAVEGARERTFQLGLAADIFTASSVVLGVVSLVLVLVDTGGGAPPDRVVRAAPGGLAIAF